MSSSARDVRVDDLDRLTERGLEAFVNGRDALALTLYTRAENLALELHPDDNSLVPAWLQSKRAAAVSERVQVVHPLCSHLPSPVRTSPPPHGTFPASATG